MNYFLIYSFYIALFWRRWDSKPSLGTGMTQPDKFRDRWWTLLLVELAKGLVVKSYLLTLIVFWGMITPGKWESRLGVKVYTSAQSLIKLIYQSCSRSRAARSPHTIRTWLTWISGDGCCYIDGGCFLKLCRIAILWFFKGLLSQLTFAVATALMLIILLKVNNPD